MGIIVLPAEESLERLRYVTLRHVQYSTRHAHVHLPNSAAMSGYEILVFSMPPRHITVEFTALEAPDDGLLPSMMY